MRDRGLGRARPEQRSARWALGARERDLPPPRPGIVGLRERPRGRRAPARAARPYALRRGRRRLDVTTSGRRGRHLARAEAPRLGGSPGAGASRSVRPPLCRRRRCGWRWCARATRTGAWRRTTFSGSWGLRPGLARPVRCRPIGRPSGPAPCPACAGRRRSRPALGGGPNPRLPGLTPAAAEGRRTGRAGFFGPRAGLSWESPRLFRRRGAPVSQRGGEIQVLNPELSCRANLQAPGKPKRLMALHPLWTYVCASENSGPSVRFSPVRR